MPIAVIDPDGNALTLELPTCRASPPSPTGQRQGLLRIAPGDRDRGNYVVTLLARDDGDGDGAGPQPDGHAHLRHQRARPCRAAAAAPAGDRWRWSASRWSSAAGLRPGPGRADLQRHRPARRRHVDAGRGLRHRAAPLDATRSRCGQPQRARSPSPTAAARSDAQTCCIVVRASQRRAACCCRSATAGGRRRHAAAAAGRRRCRRRCAALQRGQPAGRRQLDAAPPACCTGRRASSRPGATPTSC